MSEEIHGIDSIVLGEKVDIARQRLDLEEKKHDEDARFRQSQLEEQRLSRESEQKIKSDEIAFRREELKISQGQGLKFSQTQAIVLCSVVSVLGGVFGGLMQGGATVYVESKKADATRAIEELKVRSIIDVEQQKSLAQQILEREKFEATLVLKATESQSKEERIRNLKFFVNAGYIKDSGGLIAKMADNDYPYLPKASEALDLSTTECDRPSWVFSYWTVDGERYDFASVLPVGKDIINISENGDKKKHAKFVHKVSAFSDAWYNSKMIPPAKALARFEEELPQPAEIKIETACGIDGRNAEIDRVNQERNDRIISIPLATDAR